MTAPDSPATSTTPVPQPATSSWAVASLLCSIAVCCPLMPLVGALLGIRALVEINAHPTAIRGRAMARAGIAIGVIAALLWIGFFAWWHFNARIPMRQGPVNELQAGMSGNVAAFKAGFSGAGATAPDEQARVFLHELESRYGRLLGSQISASSATQAPLSGPAEIPIAYTFTFARKNVEAEAVFLTFAPTRLLPQPRMKWLRIRIIDPERGDLVYPVH